MAFPHLKAGNDLVAGARPFNGEAYRRLVDELLTIKADLTDTSRTETPQPIFIIGQPRSGTTLVEQILASHPDVDATDELPFMGHRGADLQREGGYAERLIALSEDRWQAYRNEYLKVVEALSWQRGTGLSRQGAGELPARCTDPENTAERPLRACGARPARQYCVAVQALFS